MNSHRAFHVIHAYCWIPFAILFLSQTLPANHAEAQVERILTGQSCNGNSQDALDYNQLVFSPDGTNLAAATRDEVHIWDVNSGKQIACYAMTGDYFLSKSLLLNGGQARIINSNEDRYRWNRISLKNDQPLAPQILSFVGEDDDIDLVVHSGNGAKTVAVVDRNNRDTNDLVWFDTESGKEQRSIEYPDDSYLSYALNADGTFLAIGTGERTNALQLVDPLKKTVTRRSGGFASGAYFPVFSPDNQLIATISTINQKEGLTLWNAQTLRPERGLHFDGGYFEGEEPEGPIVFSPSGQLVAVNTEGEIIHLFDWGNKKTITTLRGYRARQYAFSPDGELIASTYGNGEVVLWRWKDTLRTIGPDKTFRSHPAGKRYPQLAFSPKTGMLGYTWARENRGTLYSGTASVNERIEKNRKASGPRAEDVTIVLFDPASNKASKLTTKGARYRGSNGRIRELRTDYFLHLAFSPDGKWLAAPGNYDNGVCVWDMSSQKLVNILDKYQDQGQELEVKRVDFSPDSKHLAAVGEDRDLIRLHEVGNDWKYQDFPGKIKEDSIRFSPTGQQIVSGLSLWDAETGDRLMDTTEVSFDYYAKTLFSPDGKKVYGIRENAVAIWNLDTATVSFPFSFNRGTNDIDSLDIALSKSGRVLAVASFDKKIRLWDTQANKLLVTLVGHEAEVNSIDFAPDGKTLASISSDGTIRLWDVEQFTGDESVQAPVDRLPTFRRIKLSNGITISISADHDATPEELRAAAQELLEALRN